MLRISSLLGTRILHTLGADDLNTTQMREYPSDSAIEAYKNDVSKMSEIDAKSLRVVPDKVHPSKFVIISHQHDGLYKRVKDGFADRASASSYRDDLARSRKTLALEKSEGRQESYEKTHIRM